MATNGFLKQASSMRADPVTVREEAALAARALGDACKATASLALRMDDGSRRVVPAWRSRCDFGFAASQGPVRLASQAPGDADERRALAAALQCAAFQLPYGGVCGGAVTDRLSPDELCRLMRSYAQAFPDMVSTVPCPGTGAAAGTLLSGWLDREDRTVHGGVPRRGRADLLREDAIALGAGVAVELLRTKPGRWVLYGFDRPALHLARRLRAAGWCLTAVGDGEGAVANPLGLTPSELACTMAVEGSVAPLAGKRGTQAVADALEVEADLVVVAGPARFDGAAALRLPAAAVVIELVAEAVTAEAEALLAAKGLRFVPEMLAGGGAAILTHLRWLQRRRRLDWTGAQLTQRLASRLRASLTPLLAEEDECLRLAGLTQALHFLRAARSGTAMVSAV